MCSYRRKVIPVLVVFLFSASIASAALSIETFDGNLDINTISPDSEAAQLVKVTDGQGDQVNESVLLNASGNEFQYYYDGNWTDMEHLMDGYYYALFDSGSSVGNIQYRVIDQSPGGGETEVAEILDTGQLDINIQSNFSGRYEAGSTVDIEAEVINQGDYYTVDGTNRELIITDNGGSGTYSSTSDTLLAGYAPDNGEPLSSTNPWSDTEHVVAMNDSNTGDDWNPGSDIIVLDRHGGGTISTEPDQTINSGSDDSVDTEAGEELQNLGDVGDSIYFVSSDEQLDEGEAVVYDNDSDGMYTANPDEVIAGDEPAEGTSVSFTDSVPARMEIASYDANTDGGAWDSSEDLIVYDRDEDSQYTDQEDVRMYGAVPSEAAHLNTSHVDSWNDGDYTSPTNGDLEVLDANTDDGGWNSSVDGIWIEGNSADGYQSGTGDQLVAGNPQENQAPNNVNDLLDQWPNISGYDANSGDSFDSAADAIIRDYNSGGTYSENSDTVVAGSLAPGSDFSGGSTFTSEDGFSEDWELDVIESIDGGEWKASQDTILIDRNDGGTYSPMADHVINAEGSVDAASGTELNRLNSVSDDHMMWSDVNDNGVYDTGDEIFWDLDEDGIYTAQSDEQLAGLSLDIAGAGTSIQELNLWQETPYDSTRVMFYDRYSGDGWSSVDAIVHDTDEDGVYTGRSDQIIEGDSSMAENGDGISETDVSNTSTPDLHARITTGSNTSGPLQLGRTQEGVYTGEIDIPAVHGTEMIVQVTGETPVSGLQGMESEVIRTRAKGIGFDTKETSLELDIQKKGEYSRNITVNNLLDDSNTVNLNVSEDLQNITTHDESVELSPQGNETANITFDVQEIEDREGEVTLTEDQTGISEQVDVEINVPECEIKSGDLCLTSDTRIDITTDERGNFTRTLSLLNIGEKDSERNPDVEVDGNVSDHVTVENTTSFTDEYSLEVGFSADTPGNYSGDLTVGSGDSEMVVPLTLSANFIELEAGMDVSPGELDYGVVPEGDDANPGDVMVENTGTVELVNVTVSSSAFDVSQNTDEGVETSSSRNYTLTLNSVETSEGQLEVAAYSSQGNELTSMVDVSGSTVRPVTEMKDELRSGVNDLRSRATSNEAMTQLTDIETQISSIQTSWDQGNYQEAQNKYQTAQSDLSAVETQVQSNSNSEPSDPSGQDGSGSEDNNESSGGGGGGILIFLFLLILILGAGFVVYTSYYPEEGDPLYDVLGDRE